MNNGKGIEFAIFKTFYRKYYKPLHQINKIKAFNVKNNVLHQKPIIVFGGGANLEFFCSGNYCYFPDPMDRPNTDEKYFEARPITDFVSQVDIIDEEEVLKYINLLILALGLTYEGNDDIRFAKPANDVPPLPIQDNDRYFYYDLQDAVFK